MLIKNISPGINVIRDFVHVYLTQSIGPKDWAEHD
jgi:hypothetical protein